MIKIEERQTVKLPGITSLFVTFDFNKQIIDATLDVVACYKVQIAYYEALGMEGMIAYKNTLQYICSINYLSYSRHCG